LRYKFSYFISQQKSCTTGILKFYATARSSSVYLIDKSIFNGMSRFKSTTYKSCLKT